MNNQKTLRRAIRPGLKLTTMDQMENNIVSLVNLFLAERFSEMIKDHENIENELMTLFETIVRDYKDE